MTTQEQNVAIAELCGWEVPDHVRTKTGKSGSPPDFGKNPKTGKWESGIPNYAADLNAMNDAELHSGLNQIDNSSVRIRWVNALREIVGRECPKNKAGAALVSDVDLLTATAAQRAEAFLKTIGAWHD